MEVELSQADLTIICLPTDQLAFTNKVFVGQTLYDAWRGGGFNALLVASGCFAFALLDSVQAGQIAMSSNQRRTLGLNENGRITVRPISVTQTASAQLKVILVDGAHHVSAPALKQAVEKFTGNPIYEGQSLIFAVGAVFVCCTVAVNGHLPVLLGEFCLEASNGCVLSVDFYP